MSERMVKRLALPQHRIEESDGGAARGQANAMLACYAGISGLFRRWIFNQKLF